MNPFAGLFYYTLKCDPDSEYNKYLISCQRPCSYVNSCVSIKRYYTLTKGAILYLSDI